MSDGTSISGKVRLTSATIGNPQSFYGLALSKNKGNVRKMADAVSAILQHYSQNPNLNKCPKGPNSWCSYNRDIATAKSTYRPIKDPLSPAIITVIKPLFYKLGSERFLSSCENAKTQNLNETYHHLV